MKPGIELIAEERQRQIEVEDYSQQHDSQHRTSEFIYAAITYAESAKRGVISHEMGDDNEIEIMVRKNDLRHIFPWGDSFKPSTDIRDLVKAGALIAAAIDKLQLEESASNKDIIGNLGNQEFIKKVCLWLNDNFKFDEAGYCESVFYSKNTMLDNFKTYMENK